MLRNNSMYDICPKCGLRKIIQAKMCLACTGGTPPQEGCVFCGRPLDTIEKSRCCLKQACQDCSHNMKAEHCQASIDGRGQWKYTPRADNLARWSVDLSNPFWGEPGVTSKSRQRLTL